LLSSAAPENEEEASVGSVDLARIESAVLPCLPVECHELILELAKTLTGSRSADSPLIGMDTITISLAPLLKGLLTSFSVVVMLPLLALEGVRSIIAAPERMLDNRALRHRLEELCPEVHRALADTYKKCKLVFPMVLKFIASICDIVECWARCTVEPPDFHPMPGSYNPEVTGLALHLTPSRLQGRLVRRYVSDGAVDHVACNKDFKTARGRTGGLFRYIL
jgi:hypothetical protein